MLAMGCSQNAIVQLLFLWHTVSAYMPLIRKLTSTEIGQFERNQNRGAYQTTLDYAGKYELRWEFGNDTITFTVDVEATGWVGLGFSPTSSMTGADIVFIWIDANGKGHITDRYAKGNEYPKKDHQQDYELLEASKTGSHFQAKFRRRKDTCDDKGDYKLTSDNVRIIYAFSNTLPVDEEHFEVHSATDRGVKGIFLFDPPDVQVQLPNDTIVMDMLSDGALLPTDYHLMYWCQIFEMPRWPIHHLIRLEPILENGHEPLVHHIGVFQCSKNMSAYMEKGERCFAGGGFNYSKMHDCATKLLWFWNPGMKPTDFPRDVGLPLFESLSDGYLMVEFHYENIQLIPGIVDHSGVRLYLTPTLRPIDAGVMFLGTTEQPPNQIIPPGESEFHFYAHFDNCLAVLPPNGTNLLYSLLHMHLYGKRIRLHHYRNGVQLPDLAIDDNYDFFSQNFRVLDPPRHILPGDQLVLECVYDTSKTNKTIYGGFSTLDEMCDSAHIYYPRVARSFECFSYPDPHAYVPLFEGKLLDNTTVLLPSDQNVTLQKFVTEYLNWEQAGMREKYTDLILNGQYLQEFFYQPLKNLSADSSEDTPVQFHVFTRDGYPKVTQAWIPKSELRQCPSISKWNAIGGTKTTKQRPKVLTESGANTAKVLGQQFCIWTIIVAFLGLKALMDLI